MDRFQRRLGFISATLFGLSVGSLSDCANAQHLNVKPLAAVAESSADSLTLNADAQTGLPQSLPIHKLDKTVTSSSASITERRPGEVAARMAHRRVENWLVVSVLGVAFSIGVVLTVTAVRSQPSDLPGRIL